MIFRTLLAGAALAAGAGAMAQAHGSCEGEAGPGNRGQLESLLATLHGHDASKAQVERFAGTIGEANHRPVQPLNARAVLR